MREHSSQQAAEWGHPEEGHRVVAELDRSEHAPHHQRVGVEHGHTDDRGSDDYNLELSHNRAREVGNYLITHGIADTRIRIKGFGKQYPLVNQVNEEARTINRRVEARFLK